MQNWKKKQTIKNIFEWQHLPVPMRSVKPMSVKCVFLLFLFVLLLFVVFLMFFMCLSSDDLLAADARFW